MSELEISVSELQRRRKAGEKFLLIDVREQWEFDTCRIEGGRLISMSMIPANLQTLDVDEEVICYCHYGMRSLDVAAWLRAQGIENRGRSAAESTAGPWRSIPASHATEPPIALCPHSTGEKECRKLE